MYRGFLSALGGGILWIGSRSVAWKAAAGFMIFVLTGHPALELLHRWRMGGGAGISLENSLYEPIRDAFVPAMWPITTVLGILGIFAGLGFAYLQRHWSTGVDVEARNVCDQEALRSLILEGESERLEFKSSLRWDWKRGNTNKALETVIAKTLSGLMNQRGGKLLIGVDDDGSILGIESDLKTLRRRDLDGFEQRLVVLVTTHLGGQHSGAVHATFVAAGGLTVAVVHVDSVADPVFCKVGDTRHYYLRAGNTTTELDVSEALAHIAGRKAAS